MVSNMINMGEKIHWGQETALMDEAADALEALTEAHQAGYNDALKEAVRVIEGKMLVTQATDDAHRFYQVKDFNNGLSTAISTLEGLVGRENDHD